VGVVPGAGMGDGGSADAGGDAGYLQQSFLRMKIAFSSRRKNPPMAGMMAVGGLSAGGLPCGALSRGGLMDMGSDIIDDRTDGG